MWKVFQSDSDSHSKAGRKGDSLKSDKRGVSVAETTEASSFVVSLVSVQIVLTNISGGKKT